MKAGAYNMVGLCGTETSSPVNYNDVGEQPVHVVTPLVAVLAVVSTFVMTLLAIAFITDTGISYLRRQRGTACTLYRYLILQLIARSFYFIDRPILVQGSAAVWRCSAFIACTGYGALVLVVTSWTCCGSL